MKRSEVFSAVNSAEQLRYDLENQPKASRTSDYLIASNVNSNALLGGKDQFRRSPFPAAFSHRIPPLPLILALETRIRIHHVTGT